jgi:hypothetical protein
MLPNAAPLYRSLGIASVGTIKSTAGKVLSVSAENNSDTMGWLQLYGDVSLSPAGLVDVLPVYPGSYSALDSTYFTPFGLDISPGIYWGWSLSPKVFTSHDGSFLLLKVRYL